MNYQVLARKWRPSTFTEVVGQSHVVNPLQNALKHNRLHHAYLFTGTRGVGKTTIARILAKAINCENLRDFNPCGECLVCRELDEGRFLDLIEVDAASRTKVEDTRDLLDNAQYAPSRARYKVYIIDEVHMLSGHSFNALLKTLEEPPPHVKFLLATTDPQKIPVTVLSRCLQFNLKRLLPEQIFEQMLTILSEEQINSEPEALRLIARAADGSMRDGLSLLDQAIVFGEGAITSGIVNAMLGTSGQNQVQDILFALNKQDGKRILEIVDEISNIQADFSTVLDQILHVLHRIALAQQIPGAIGHEFDNEMITGLAQQLSQADVQLFYQMGLVGQKDLDLAPNSRMGFEMLMLRMLAFRPVKPSTARVDQSTDRIKNPKPEHNTTDFSNPLPLKKNTDLAATNNAPQPIVDYPAGHNWSTMITSMKLESLTKELANNCVLEAIDNQNIKLILDSSHKHLLTPGREQKLQTSLRDYLAKPLKLIITIGGANPETPAAQMLKQQEDRQQMAVDAINTDANIQALKEYFDASIIPGSIEPV